MSAKGDKQPPGGLLDHLVGTLDRFSSRGALK